MNSHGIRFADPMWADIQRRASRRNMKAGDWVRVKIAAVIETEGELHDTNSEMHNKHGVTASATGIAWRNEDD